MAEGQTERKTDNRETDRKTDRQTDRKIRMIKKLKGRDRDRYKQICRAPKNIKAAMRSRWHKMSYGKCK